MSEYRKYIHHAAAQIQVAVFVMAGHFIPLWAASVVAVAALFMAGKHYRRALAEQP